MSESSPTDGKKKKRPREGEPVQNSVVLSHQRPIEIVDEVTKQKVKDLQNQYDMATNANAGKEIGSHLSYFSVSALDYVQLLFKMHHKQHPGQFEGLTYANAKDFRDWTSKDFFELLKKAIPEDDTTVMSLSVSDQFMKHHLDFDVTDGLGRPFKFMRLNLDIRRTYESEVEGKEEPFVKILIDQIVTENKFQHRFKKLVQTVAPKPTTVTELMGVIGETAQKMCQTYTEASAWGMVFPSKEKHNGDKSGATGLSELKVHSKNKKYGLCNGCGSEHTLKRECLLMIHPDFNKSNLAWKESVKGKAWNEKGFSHLPWKRTLDNSEWDYPKAVEEHFGKK